MVRLRGGWRQWVLARPKVGGGVAELEAFGDRRPTVYLDTANIVWQSALKGVLDVEAENENRRGSPCGGT